MQRTDHGARWPAPRWRPGWLLVLNGAGLALLASMVWMPGAVFWRELDRAVFLALNGTLSEAGAWAYVWARLNGSPTDTVSGLLMLLTLTLAGPVFRPSELRRGFLGFLCLLALGLLMRFIVHELGVWLSIGGPGPSNWVEPAYLLGDHYPGNDIKDQSDDSFPGDHAAVLLLWAFYVALFARPWPALVMVAAALFMVLPRLFAGAHGLSDVLVGSTAVVLFTLAWALCTPFLAGGSLWLALKLDPLTDWFASRVPPLKWFAYFRNPAGGSV